MPTIEEQYVRVTKEAKQAIKDRDTTQRTSEEQRVYDVFRRHARDAFGKRTSAGGQR